MIAEDFCSFEVAKLLKEKGFNEDCKAYYEDSKFCWVWNDGCSRNTDNPKYVSCPSQALAMKWLREKWIFIEISFSVTINGEPCYNFGILSRSAQWVYRHKQSFSTYEEAVEAALKYCLTKLI